MEKLTLKVDTGAVTVDVENENGKKIESSSLYRLIPIL